MRQEEQITEIQARVADLRLIIILGFIGVGIFVVIVHSMITDRLSNIEIQVQRIIPLTNNCIEIGKENGWMYYKCGGK